MKIRWLLSAVFIMVLAASANTMAQAYPAKPIRYVLPFAAASAVDVFARFYGQKMSENWKQQVVVDNRTGANGIIARLNAEVVRITRLPETGERLSAVGFDLVGSSPEEFGAHIKANIARIGKVVREAGIRAE